MSDMRRTWLIQRLEKPATTGFFANNDNPFSFGGGLKNGGLRDEAMALLRGIFRFDYMGAAEFEFGAVPEALQRIAKSDSLVAYEVHVPLKVFPEPWDGWNKPKGKKAPAPEGHATIYVLSPKEWTDEITERIAGWCKEPYKDLKETTRLGDVFRPPADDKYPTRVRGWLELDNGFFFFSDQEMFHKTCDLFGVHVEGREYPKPEPKPKSARKAKISKTKPEGWDEEA